MALNETAAKPPVASSGSIRSAAGDFFRLIRIQAAGFEGFSFTMGALLTGAALSITQLTVLWVLGILINGYIFTLNDFVDLPRDRENPARATTPLVSGRVSPNIALILSIAFPVVSMALIVAVGWPRTAAVAFAFFLVMGAVVNVYQKLTDKPVLMDSMFAITMAAPVAVTAAACSDRIPGVVWIATAFMFFLALELNSVAGNLKDLSSDLVTGFRTVAVTLGATTSSEGNLVPGVRYRRYCAILHGITTLTGLIAVAVSIRTSSWTDIALGAACIGISVAGCLDLYRLLAGLRRPSPRGRESYFAAGFAVMIIVIALNADLTAFWCAVAALLVWESIFGLLRYRRNSRPAGPRHHG